jgi:predicted CXXCH cytochrome family protein
MKSHQSHAKALVVLFSVISITFSLALRITEAKQPPTPNCSASKCHASLKTGAVVHSPVETNDCDLCHVPNKGKAPSKDHPKILTLSDKELNSTCLGCHDNIKQWLAKNPIHHNPVDEGQCTSCHMPHGSAEKSLLSSHYSDQFYILYDENAYQLCFNCHDSELSKAPGTSEATAFRNGTVNLHYLHLQQKPKGRACRACHDVHAGPNPKMIQNWIPYQGVQVPLQFKKTTTGGSCTAACHKLKRYDREHEVMNERGK